MVIMAFRVRACLPRKRRIVSPVLCRKSFCYGGLDRSIRLSALREARSSFARAFRRNIQPINARGTECFKFTFPKQASDCVSTALRVVRR